MPAGPLARATRWGWTASVSGFPIRLCAMITWKEDAALPIDGDRGGKSEFPCPVHGSCMPRGQVHRGVTEGSVIVSKSSDARMFPRPCVAVSKCGAAARHSFQSLGSSRRAHLKTRSSPEDTTCSVRRGHSGSAARPRIPDLAGAASRQEGGPCRLQGYSQRPAHI